MTTILTYRFSAFGDVAMCVPVLQELIEQNPNVEVIFVSRKNFAPLFAKVPGVKFVGVNLEEYKGFFGLRRLSKKLRLEQNPDAVADLHNVIRGKFISRYFKSKGYNVAVLDKGKEEKEQLTDVWNLDKTQLKHTTERYADVFRSLGFNLQLSHALRPISTERSAIGIAPFAQHKGKMLPLEESFKLAEILSQNEKVYFFGGGKTETELLKEWEKALPNTESLAGKLNLNEELEVISRLKLMISMDSANMHLASLMGTRCISIWGATHPFAGFLGYGQSMQDVIQVQDLTCRPCSVFGDKECYRGDYACLMELDSQRIAAIVQNSL